MEGGRMFKRLLKPRGILTNMNYDNTTKMLLLELLSMCHHGTYYVWWGIEPVSNGGEWDQSVMVTVAVREARLKNRLITKSLISDLQHNDHRRLDYNYLLYYR